MPFPRWRMAFILNQPYMVLFLSRYLILSAALTNFSSLIMDLRAKN